MAGQLLLRGFKQLNNKMMESLGSYERAKESGSMQSEYREGAYNSLVGAAVESGFYNKESWDSFCKGAETLYMEEHYSMDETKRKKNGSWNISSVFDTAYRSAKSTIGNAIEAGVILVDANGIAKGKSQLYKEAKAVAGEVIEVDDKEPLEKAKIMAETLIKYCHKHGLEVSDLF